MKKWYALVLVLLIIQGSAFCQKNKTLENLKGEWLGKLTVQAFELRIVFRFTEDSTGALKVFLDSPDQGAKDIPALLTKVSGDSVRIDIKSIMAHYEALLTGDTLLSGDFNQAGMKLPLTLTHQRKAFVLERPQNPKPPFDYEIREVEFVNLENQLTLSGTVTYPKGGGKFPGVVLISGSGPQNRDEELLGHKPFWVIADHLTRHGIAVLRYDDRGFGKSEGLFGEANTLDFASDARAAFSFLKNQSFVDSAKTGLAGHSEGGLIAQILGAGMKDIDFLVLLAAPGIRGDETLLLQAEEISRASGMSEKDISRSQKTNKKIYAVLMKESNQEVAADKIKKILQRHVKKLSQEEKQAAGLSEEYIRQMVNQVNSNWFRTFLKIDPVNYLKEITCPVLALNGSLDLQVLPDENLSVIEQTLILAGNPAVTVIEPAGLNHLFQPARTGLPGEYGQIETTFDPAVLQLITDFIIRTTKP